MVGALIVVETVVERVVDTAVEPTVEIVAETVIESNVTHQKYSRASVLRSLVPAHRNLSLHVISNDRKEAPLQSVATTTPLANTSTTTTYSLAAAAE